MDKYQYKKKIEEMLALVTNGDIGSAAGIADTIEWRRVQSISMLMLVGSIYESSGRIGDARDVLYIAYDRTKKNKTVLYRLTDLAVKSGDLEDADECYHEYMKIADRDPNKFILEYKLSKMKKEPLEKQISILENLKNFEYTEKTALELAMLYYQAGMIDKCISECDEIFLWFSDGKYVKRALKLKEKFIPLTVFQKDVLAQDDQDTKEKSEMERSAQMLLDSEKKYNKVGEDEVKENKLRGFDNTMIPGASIAGNLDMDIDGLRENENDNIQSDNKDLELYADDLDDTTEIELINSDENYNQDDIDDYDLKIKDDDSSNDEDKSANVKFEDHRIGLGAFKYENDEASAQKNQPQNTSGNYIDENVEYPQKEVSEDTLYEEEDNKEAIQIEPPTYDEKDKEEIQKAAKNFEGAGVLATDSLFGETSKKKLEEKLEDETKVVKSEGASADISSVDLQSEIQAGLAMISDDKNMKKECDRETEMTEITANSLNEQPGDGRFLVEEKFNLDSQSARRGAEAGLSEIERKIFSYFVPVRGMSNQIVDVLAVLKEANREGTSRTGNLIITGEQGSGKTKLAIDVVKTIQRQYKNKKGRIAIVKGADLNGKSIDNVIRQIYDGALVIEKASGLDKRTIASLADAMRSDTGELLILLEDTKENIDFVLGLDESFSKMFSARLDVPKFVNDELVTFAQTYAKENGYRIQEMAILALYNRIDRMQRDDHSVTVAEVAGIMDEAFEKSKKNSLKRTMTNLFKNSNEDKTMTLLMEEDFE